MKLLKYMAILTGTAFMVSCSSNNAESKTGEVKEQKFVDVSMERFADIEVLKYQISLEKLSKKQKEYVYYLSEAALAGRDIFYQQNYKHNLQIRRSLENIYSNYEGDKTTEDWNKFETYLKRVWFSNGIHHHYGEVKFLPEFSQDYFTSLVAETKGTWPLKEGQTAEQMWGDLLPAMYDPAIGSKKVNKDNGIDQVLVSANNHYAGGVTTAEVEAFYKGMVIPGDTTPVEYGLNSYVAKEDGKLVEHVYKVGGMYGEAIEKAVFWLKKAAMVTENEAQAKHLNLLIEYYETGDLKVWDETNIQWVKTTEGDIDFIHGFIEVYGDAMGNKADFEAAIEINDFDASERMKVLADNVQWFEDQSPLMEEHKKKNVTGVTYKVVNVAMEAGATSPSTPIGINLPNSNWIRTVHGSKSVSLGNIVQAYSDAKGSGFLQEFAYNEEEVDLSKKYGKIAGKMHTAMHEVIGHASGQINKGVGQPKETMKNYASTLEEARADLVGLYYIMDQKIIDLGLVETLDIGKTEYQGYIRNGMMTQLTRLKLGDKIEEDHMRNRQLVAGWAYEKGMADTVISKVTKDGKTYFIVNNFVKLRDLFGQLLKEIQRIKSEGDYEAGKALVENYGVQVDQELHKEVLERYATLNTAPYSGFMQPTLVPEFDADGNFVDLKATWENSFADLMMKYAKDYSFLPN
jgi:dipeptidyl-peptidase-3